MSALESAILLKHGCRPFYRKTDFVRVETRNKETIWEGHVETFELIGHTEAKSCYVWEHVDSKGDAKIFAVLGNHSIQSAETAVRAALFADIQPATQGFSDRIVSLKRLLEDYKRLIRKMGIVSDDLSDSIESAKGIAESIIQRRFP